MKRPYLLDTSTLLWTIVLPERLTPAARSAVEYGDLALSVATYWELSLKAKRLPFGISDPVEWWRQTVALLGVKVLSIGPSHIDSLQRLPEIHRDPFDRILVAQALAEGMVLVTSDKRIREYPVEVCW